MSDPNWWELLKQIFGSSTKNLSGIKSSLDQPKTNPKNLVQRYTVSGAYVGSGLQEAFNNPQFYYIDNSGEFQQVQNINRIIIIKRAYDDGSVGIVFQDLASGAIVMPRGVQFNGDVYEDPNKKGEYVLRNGGSTNGGDNLNYMWNSDGITYQIGVLRDSVIATPPDPTPTPAPTPTTEQKNFNASDLDITFRQMQGNTSIIYNGSITVKQWKNSAGEWVINFYDSDGVSLGVSDTNTDRRLWRRLWSGADSGFIIPDSYLRYGDNDALDWVETAFKKSEPEPTPEPEPNTQQFKTNTNQYNLLFNDSGGNRYIGEVDIIYQFNSGKWEFRAVKGGSNDILTITGDNINIIGRTGESPIYGLDYEDGVSFSDTFEETFGGAPPEPEPIPTPELKKIQINLIKGQTSIQAYSWDGTKSIEADSFTIHLEEQPDGSYQVYSTDNNNNRLWVNLSNTGLKLNRLGNGNWEIPAGQIPEGATAENVQNYFLNSYQKEPEPEPPEPGPPTPPPPPTPTPGPDPTPATETAGDEERGRINTIDHPGLIFRDSSGQIIEDNLISLYVKGDTDGDGKTEIYFRISGTGEPATIEQAQNYHYLDFPQPDTAGPQRRRLQETGPQITLYDVETGQDRIDELFENGFGASPNISLKEMNLLDALKIKAFVLYKKSEKSQFVIKDRDNILNGLHIVGIMKDNIGKKKQFIPIHNLTEGTAPGQAPLFPEFRGTATTTGGEPARERFDLYSPPDLCGGGGTGRRLMQCGPDEPAPEYNSFKNDYSRMDLLNFERNRKEQDRRDIPNYRLSQFERMRETTNERELISMYGTFSSASYIPEDKRPESLFGLDYDKKHSSNNRAVYIGRANKNGIISLRGTKPGNVVDLMSDALILTGYEEKLSLRFEESLRNVKEIMDAHPTTDFTLSSHSLGGALNEYVINELKGTPYEKRIKAISFNPGKAPNVKTKRAEEVSDLITNASVAKAFRDQDPRFLPIYSSIQRDLGITAENITNPDILTNEQEMAQLIENYPTLTRSFNDLMGRISSLGTVEERTAEASAWISENEALLGTINYTASLLNIIKVKMLFDITLKIFDFTANYTIDSFLERESEMDKKLNRAVKPYKVLWSEGQNVIFKYKQDPISLHHSFFEDERQNVRTYKGDEKSILWEGLDGRMSQGLKEHSMDNFLIDDHKKLLNHSETWGEYFNNLLNDNIESTGEILNGIKNKLSEVEKEYIRNNGWASFLNLF